MSDVCNPANCPVAARLDSMEKAFDRYRERSSETHRQMFDRIGALEQDSTALKTKLDGMDDKLDGITSTVNALASKPAKRWDSIVDKVILVVCTAIITFLLGKVGL